MGRLGIDWRIGIGEHVVAHSIVSAIQDSRLTTIPNTIWPSIYPITGTSLTLPRRVNI